MIIADYSPPIIPLPDGERDDTLVLLLQLLGGPVYQEPPEVGHGWEHEHAENPTNTAFIIRAGRGGAEDLRCATARLPPRAFTLTRLR